MARVDPYRQFNFAVEINGTTIGYFTECTGFGASIEVTEHNEGGDVGKPRKLPGQVKYNNITLKWGLTDSTDLWDWFQEIVDGKVTRKNGSIIVRDLDGVTEKVRWNFFDAWPTKWDGPGMNAKGSDLAIESLELAVERFERG